MAASETRVAALSTVERTESYSDAEWQALKSTMGKDITNADFTVFMAAARHLGLDAFARQVRLLKIDGQLTAYTTIDGLRIVSQRSRNIEAEYGPQWCGKDGQWRDEWIADEPPAGARFGIKLRDRPAIVWGFARFKSYAKANTFWQHYPEVMIAKVAESICRKRATPNETSGLYVDAELRTVNDLDDAAAQALPAGTVDTDPESPEQGYEQPVETDEERMHRRYREEKAQRARIVEQADALNASEAASPLFVELRARMRKVNITTINGPKGADALCREACGKTWAQCRTMADYEAVDALVARLEEARDASEAEEQAAEVEA